ncbi:MAG: Cadmium, cobalt and zinc/H(+)-K(+) antiporter [Betaproteobacteria bacterium ADurb.Bin341]|nr:MAG: Cadmium, cobalt and zinc/H(+)-K(+) antiporter [Betaproteobacteria bacterium ADurb.Bin341]
MSEHCQHHGHAHTHAPATYNRAFALGIGLNLAFVLIEAGYGWKVDSLALLADAGHNLSDVAGLVLAWGATLAERLQPDTRHTYGWKRASILAAFANAILLLMAMGALAWEAAQRLQAPGATEGMTIMVIAGIGVVINGVTAALFMHGSKTDLNLRGAFLHMAADALVSLGVVVSGALYLWQGWNWLDPVVSLLVALLIVAGTWKLFRQSLHLLFDGVPASIELNEVRNYLCRLPGVAEVHDLHVWAMSSQETALTAHLVMPDGHPGDHFYQQTAATLHTRFGIAHPTLQIELTRIDDGCLPPATSAKRNPHE